MKKKLYQLIAAMLVIFCVVSTEIPTASAAVAPPSAELQYTGFSTVAFALNINIVGKANCYSYVSVNPGYTAKLTMTLQQSTNGLSWKSLKSWSTSGTPDLELEKNWYILSGYVYREKVVVTAYNSSGKAVYTTTEYSPTQSY